MEPRINGEKRFALVIDADNVSARYVNVILDELSKYGTVTYKRIYGDWTSTLHSKWKNTLLDNSITPIQQFSYTQGKNATDHAMIIDAMDILYTGQVDGFCIVSSDSDFTRLAARIRESGLMVIGMGEKKTPLAFRKACDIFTTLELLIKDVPTQKGHVSGKSGRTTDSPAPAISRERIEEAVISIVTYNQNNGKDTGLGEVGSRLQKRYPDFDVRNYGTNQLRKLLESFASITVTKEGNSLLVSFAEGYEPPAVSESDESTAEDEFATEMAAAEAAAEATADADANAQATEPSEPELEAEEGTAKKKSRRGKRGGKRVREKAEAAQQAETAEEADKAAEAAGSAEPARAEEKNVKPEATEPEADTHKKLRRRHNSSSETTDEAAGESAQDDAPEKTESPKEMKRPTRRPPRRSPAAAAAAKKRAEEASKEAADQAAQTAALAEEAAQAAEAIASEKALAEKTFKETLKMAKAEAAAEAANASNPNPEEAKPEAAKPAKKSASKKKTATAQANADAKKAPEKKEAKKQPTTQAKKPTLNAVKKAVAAEMKANPNADAAAVSKAIRAKYKGFKLADYGFRTFKQLMEASK